MSDDAIKAALVAAWRLWMTDPDNTTPEHQAWAMRISAEAVAAFLRALPTGSGRGLLEFGADDNVTSWAIGDLAAAVERAAREGSDDR